MQKVIDDHDDEKTRVFYKMSHFRAPAGTVRRPNLSWTNIICSGLNQSWKNPEPILVIRSATVQLWFFNTDLFGHCSVMVHIRMTMCASVHILIQQTQSWIKNACRMDNVMYHLKLKSVKSGIDMIKHQMKKKLAHVHGLSIDDFAITIQLYSFPANSSFFSCMWLCKSNSFPHYEILYNILILHDYIMAFFGNSETLSGLDYGSNMF